LFEQGVQKPEDRPGVQTYIFQQKNRPVCQQSIKHFHAAESF
jgi:hypothetical protein